MNWHFRGTIARKQLLPPEGIDYHIPVEWTTSELFLPSLRSLLSVGKATLSITTASSAIDQLKNQLEKAAPLLKESKADAISFAQFWHDPKGKDHLFSVVLGLSDLQLDAIAPDLNMALLHGCPISVSVLGGFSSVDPNPYSKQPTQEYFELGVPMSVSISHMMVAGPTAKVFAHEC